MTRRWLIPVLSVLCAATAIGVSAVAHAATACRVAYSVTGQWQNGFQAALTVTNLGDAWNGWTLTFPFTAGQKVTQLWGATWTQPAETVTATSASWNAAVPTNGSTSIGFLASWSGTNPAPTSFAVNGVACTGSVPPTTAPTATTAPTRPTTPTTRLTPTTRATPTSPACAGRITYTLNRASNPTADQLSAYNQITTAMNQALSVYNCQTAIAKALTVSYDPGVPTADANYSGHIRFGARSSMQQITAMHEIAHTLGVGTAPGWSSRLSNGVWTGAAATAELRRQTGDNSAVLRGDSQHFWPYGLNYTSEVTSPNDLVIHCRIVVAMRQDLGI